MSITREKVLIHFGRRQRNTGAEGAWAGCPEPARLDRGAVVVDVGGPDTPLNTIDDSNYELRAPPRFASQGPISCIAIAADSPVEAVEIHVANAGGPSSHRVAVGAPYFGQIDQNSRILVSPVKPVPLLYRSPAGILNVTEYRRQVRVWDCDDDDIAGFAAVPVVAPLVPVRLDVYRGGYPPIANRRAPYHASMVWEVANDGGGAPTTPILMVHTDGRRRVRVRATTETPALVGAQPTLQVWGINARKNIHAVVVVATEITNSGRADEMAWDELLAPTQILLRGAAPSSEIIFDWTGNPYQVFACRIEAGPNNEPRGTLDLTAWDD